MMSKSSKGGGCGCGCGGSGGGGGCGCGGGKTAAQCVSGEAGCATSGQAFTRPNFFAGQLLTEEDLQALGDYVVGKNRLHNRHLFGDGVVCGLEVTCDPCGGGTVVVQPGYALDCCGNDLLLSCPTELDINAMARSLRRNMLGGYDCGDPCADKQKKRREECRQQDGEAPAETGGTTVGGMPALVAGQQKNAQAAGQATSERLRHYCLYARYCEEKTDPVSPYATDDGCTFQACQPTRVREGVTFELRCRACEHQHEDIISRICGCFGNLGAVQENSRYADSLKAFARLNSPPQQLYPRSALTNADASRAASNFARSAETLRAGSFAPRPAADAQPAAAEEKDAPEAKPSSPEAASVSEATLHNSVLNIRDAASHLAAFYAADAAGGGGAGAEDIGEAKADLLRTTEATRAALANVSTSSPEHAYYASILDGAERLAKSERPAAEISANELRAMRSGVYLSAQASASTQQKAQALREALLDALDASPRLGDCSLRRDVRAIRLPAGERGSEEELVTASKELVKAWERFLIDCVCLAFNPPCPTCDDTGVLLACLVVDEATCEVVEICNMKRKFVISPVALRYWVPPINWMGELVEEFCCGEPECPDDEGEGRLTRDPFAGGTSLAAYNPGGIEDDARQDVLRLLAKLCGAEPDRRDDDRAFIKQPSSGYNAISAALRSGSGSNIINSLRSFAARTSETKRAPEPAAAPATTAAPAESATLAAPTPTREELAAQIENVVRARIESAAATPEFRRTIAETLKAEEVSAGVRELVTRELASAQPAATEGRGDSTAAVREALEATERQVESTVQAAEADILRRVEEQVATTLSDERLAERLTAVMRSDPVAKLVGDLARAGAAGPGDGGLSAGAAESAVNAALGKLKLDNVAKDLRELKRVKTENADLRKSLSALEARLKKLEGED